MRADTGRVLQVGAWGRFDVARLGDLLQAWVLENELARRVPVEVFPFAPDGDRPMAMDGGLCAQGLGTYGEARVRELAAPLDALVIGGGAIAAPGDDARFFVEGPAAVQGRPVAWNAVRTVGTFEAAGAARLREGLEACAYVSVADEASAGTLRRAGFAGPVAVVPDPLLLAHRLLAPDDLDRRRRSLSARHEAPLEGSVVLEARALADPRFEPFGARLWAVAVERHLPVFVIDSTPGEGKDGEAARGASLSLQPVAHRVPVGASLFDLLAVIGSGALLVGGSRDALLVARGFGIPAIRPEDAAGKPAIEGILATRDPREFERLLRESLDAPRTPLSPERLALLSAHFDRLAGIVRSSTARPSPSRDLSTRQGALWRRAAEARGRELAEQHLRLADRVEARELERDRALGEAERLHGELSAEIAISNRLREDLDRSQMEAHRKTEADRSAAQSVVAALEEQAREARSEASRAVGEAEQRGREARAEAVRARSEASRAVGEAEQREREARAEAVRARNELGTTVRLLGEARDEVARLAANSEGWRQAFLRAESEAEDLAKRSAAMHAAGEARLAEAAAHALVLEEQRAQSAAAFEERLQAAFEAALAERTRLEGELAAMRAEFLRFTNLRVIRYTGTLRALYKQMRLLAGLERRRG